MTSASKSPLSLLSDLDLAHKAAKFPHVPYPPKKSFKQDGANAIEAAIVRCLRLHGFEAYRIKVTGRVIDTRKRYTNTIGETRTAGSLTWIKGTTPTGVADIDASIVPKGGTYAASVKIEVKFGRDRQSEDQKRFEARILGSKGFYVIVHSFDDFWAWFEEFCGLATMADHLDLVRAAAHRIDLD